MTTVQKIHNDFFTAGERLVNAANAIVAKGLLERNNAAKLLELGFGQCAEVRKYKSLKDLVSNGEKAAYYAQKYPTVKFITQKQVDKICKKYKLLWGDVSLYTGSIPQKNINAIVDFKVDDEDLEETFGLFSYLPLLTMNWLTNSVETKVEEPKKDTKNRKLKICAPRAMMNMQGQKMVGNEIVPQDPIVLHPVKEGFLIVTAWGDEASDEIVVNEKMN